MATTKATSSYLNQAPRTVAEVEAEMGLRPRNVAEVLAQRDIAYRAWLAADNAWHVELVKAFGKRAGDRRYDRDQSSHPETCRKAYAAWKAAGEAYLRTRENA